MIESHAHRVPVHGGVQQRHDGARRCVPCTRGRVLLGAVCSGHAGIRCRPNRVVVRRKPYSEWKENARGGFYFSLYPNDLVYAEHKKAGWKFTVQNADSTLEKMRTQTSAFVYFVGGSISTASITIRTHDNALRHPSLGVKTLKNFPQIPGRCSGQRLPRSQGNAAEIADSSKKEAVMSYRMRDRQQSRAHQHARTACCETDQRHTVPIEDISALDAGKPPRHAFGCRAFRFGAKRNGGVRVRRKVFTCGVLLPYTRSTAATCRRGTRAASLTLPAKNASAAARHRQNRQPGGNVWRCAANTRSGSFCIPRTRRDKRDMTIWRQPPLHILPALFGNRLLPAAPTMAATPRSITAMPFCALCRPLRSPVYGLLPWEGLHHLQPAEPIQSGGFDLMEPFRQLWICM